jgi:hypothetical protein
MRSASSKPCRRSGHVVTVDYDGPLLASAVADFFERQLA